MILCNYSNTDEQVSWYTSQELSNLLDKHSMDGIELFFHGCYEVPEEIKCHVQGVHLGYYPTWLDVYNTSKQENEFLTSIDEMIDNYKKEYALAKEMKAKYMVFHVGYVSIGDVFKDDFDYSDTWVLDETAKLVNSIFDEPSDVTLLFENLWWPGLKLTDKKILVDFMDKINYQNKGIMLDLSHLILTSPSIDNLNEASDYILSVIDELGEARAYIKGVHINDTKGHAYRASDLFKTHLQDKNIWEYISNLDQHLPFKNKRIQDILDFINADYQVVEVKSSSKNIWEEFLEEQMRYLK